MLRGRVSLLIALVSVLTLLIFPAMFISLTGGTGKEFCGLSSANAQDNPCLAQEGTISAMQVSMLQATLDSMNYKATITALESAVASGGGGVAGGGGGNTAVASAPGLPFVEDFSDNGNGWNLTNGVSLERGQLAVSDTSNYTIAKIPLEITGNFYLEVDAMTTSYSFDLFFGNFDANAENSLYHHISYIADNDVIRVYERSGEQGNSIATYSVSIPSNEFIRVGFSYTDGQVEIYYNSELIAIAQLNKHGDMLGIGTFEKAYFDNLEIRASR